MKDQRLSIALILLAIFNNIYYEFDFLLSSLIVLTPYIVLIFINNLITISFIKDREKLNFRISEPTSLQYLSKRTGFPPRTMYHIMKRVQQGSSIREYYYSNNKLYMRKKDIPKNQGFTIKYK